MVNKQRTAVIRLLGIGITLVLILITTAHAQPSLKPDALVVDPRFGAVEPHDAPTQADDLGIGWGRARFNWPAVQPNGPDEWINAELSPEELSNELKSGREVIGILIGIPDWARAEDGLPRGLYLPHDDPDNTWAGYVREAVTRYQGQIDHWIIWNEPDVWDTEHIANTWAGDEADYVQLLKVAYLTAKEANPNAVIHLGAFSHWWDVQHNRELYIRRFLEVLVEESDAPDHNYYYDVATLHLYFNPASVYEIIEEYRGIQAEFGLDKPFWLIETNAAPSSDPAWMVDEPTFKVSLLEQAAYMPQGLALALAAGAERVGIYKLIDTPGDHVANPEPFGLLREDSSPRPAYTTAQVAIEQLADASNAVWTDRHLVAQVVIEKPGQFTRLLWARVPFPQTVQVPAYAGSALLIDMWGNQTIIHPESDRYTITLLAGECQQTTGDYCMIGGPPVYLVEDISPPDLDNLPPLTILEEDFQIEAYAIDTGSVIGRILLPVAVAIGIGLAVTLLVISPARKLGQTNNSKANGPTTQETEG
jgi:hypothetical protein